MIWLLPHPFPPLLSVSSTGNTQKELRKSDNLLMGDVVRGWGMSQNHTTARKIGPLEIIQYSLGDIYLPGLCGTVVFIILVIFRLKYMIASV
jgi:hypothetical protein